MLKYIYKYRNESREYVQRDNYFENTLLNTLCYVFIRLFDLIHCILLKFLGVGQTLVVVIIVVISQPLGRKRTKVMCYVCKRIQNNGNSW